MESGKYALIKDGFVVNTILADKEFVKQILNQWDYIINIDNARPYPGIGWMFNSIDGSFELPVIANETIIIDGQIVPPAIEG